MDEAFCCDFLVKELLKAGIRDIQKHYVLLCHAKRALTSIMSCNTGFVVTAFVVRHCSHNFDIFPHNLKLKFLTKTTINIEFSNVIFN